MNESLAGTFAVVTGAASGIGAATVRALAARGARVAGIDRKPSTMPEGSLALTADVSSEAEVLAAFAALDAAGEVPDILVNCAGILIERSLVRMTLEEFEGIMRVNLRGCFLVGREAVIRMRGAGRGGRVINIASELAHLGRADYSAYCASKAAVIGPDPLVGTGAGARHPGQRGGPRSGGHPDAEPGIHVARRAGPGERPAARAHRSARGDRQRDRVSGRPGGNVRHRADVRAERGCGDDVRGRSPASRAVALRVQGGLHLHRFDCHSEHEARQVGRPATPSLPLAPRFRFRDDETKRRGRP